MDEMEFTFEEMRLSGEGLMAWGTATLESADESGDEFFVSSIVLDGGLKLVASGAGYLGFPSEINKILFRSIASQIEDVRTTIGLQAAEAWSERREEQAPEKPFVARLYDATREEPVMGASLAHV